MTVIKGFFLIYEFDTFYLLTNVGFVYRTTSIYAKQTFVYPPFFEVIGEVLLRFIVFQK
jgi:hypothetical protein